MPSRLLLKSNPRSLAALPGDLYNNTIIDIVFRLAWFLEYYNNTIIDTVIRLAWILPEERPLDMAHTCP